MNLFKESRLLHVTQAQIDARRMKAGLTISTTPVSKPSAVMTDQGRMSGTEYAAAKQEANKVSNQSVASYQSYIDPTTGKDTRMDAEGNISLPGTLSNRQTVGPINGQQKIAPTVIPPKTSVAPTASTLQDRVAARRQERIGKLGFAPEQFAQVEDILSKGGKYAGTQNGKPVFQLADGSIVESPVQEGDIQTAVDTATADYEGEVAGEMDQERKDLIAQQGTQTDPLTDVQTELPTDPISAGSNAAFANLPPEAQFLVPFLQQFQNDTNQSLKENAVMAEGALNRVDETYGGVEEKLSAMEDSYRATTDAMQDLLEDAKEQNDKQIALQEKSANERLAWTELQQHRTITKQKRNAHDSMVAQIALAGGFGQDAGIRAVMESDAEFDSRLDDLAVEMGYARTDLAAKFTGLYTENQNNYVNATTDNMKELRSALERISMQGISNTIARSTAEQNVLDKAWQTQVGLRQELSDKNFEVAGQIYQTIIQERDRQASAAQWEYEQAWEERKFQLQQEIAQFNKSIQTEQQDLSRFDRIVNTISDDVKADPVIKDYNTILTQHGALTSAYDEALKSDNLIAADQALIQMFNKMLDPTSVVREAEYARTPDNAPIYNRLVGKWQQVLNGGAGLTDNERKAIKRMADVFKSKYDQRYNDSAQKHLMRLQSYNSTVPPEYQITPGMVGITSTTTSQDRADLDTYLPAGYSTPHGTGNPFSGGGESTVGAEVLNLGRVTQGFSTPIGTNLYPQQTVNAWGGKHKGIDVAIPQGSAIPALTDGEVVESGYENGWGGTVVIKDARGALHRYSHLSSLGQLKNGDRVKRGQVIALSGGTKGTKGAGNSTGAHLDYRIKVGDQYVDPMTYSLQS